MKKYLLIVITLLLFIPMIHAKTIKVGIFFGRSEGDAFWGKVLKITQAACNDLGIELKAHWADGSHAKMRKQIVAASTGENKVDVLLLYNFLGILPRTLDLAKQNGVKVFVYNGTLDSTKSTHKRKDYENWIGEMLPNDEQAGYILSEHLINAAKKKGLYARDGKIHMIGIQGFKAAMVSQERIKGLQRSIQNHYKDVTFHQIVTANWDQEEARNKFVALMKRYPETTVVWSASDLMAYGVTQGIKELGKRPGHHILTGGIDWAQKGLESVSNGEFSASVGGHIWEAAWVATLIYDYYNGIDNRSFIRNAQSEMLLLDKENLETYLKYFEDEDYEKVDFKKFSKVHNKKLKNYDFRLEKVYEQLSKK